MYGLDHACKNNDITMWISLYFTIGSAQWTTNQFPIEPPKLPVVYVFVQGGAPDRSRVQLGFT